MLNRFSVASSLLLGLAVLVGAPAAAFAQDEDEEEAVEPAPATKQAKGEASLVADAEAGSSPIEQPGKTYYFVGARYRGIVVPKFMMNLFGDGGETVYVHSFGPEFAIRKDGFEQNFGLWYAAYAMDPTPFKGKNDNDNAWEIVESDLKIVYLTADFLWSHDLIPEVAINYGFGAGFGFVFGDLHRVQAYPEGGSYAPCIAEGQPNQEYCGTDNDHYGDYSEPSWADGGSKPIVFPWLVAQTGLRFKPHRNVVGRLDLGFGTSGFFFGLGADYGI